MAKPALFAFCALALALAAGRARAIIYRGAHVSMYLNASSEFAVHPTDERLEIAGHLLFLKDQRLPVNNYSGVVEVIYYNYTNLCYRVLQTIEYESCPRVANNAFRSCLHKVSRHHHGDPLRVNVSVETNVLLHIAQPQPSDSGLYVLRVRFGHNAAADVFGVYAFVYDFGAARGEGEGNGTLTPTPAPPSDPPSAPATPTPKATPTAAATEAKNGSAATFIATPAPPSAAALAQLLTAADPTVQVGGDRIPCRFFAQGPGSPTFFMHLLGIEGNMTDDYAMEEDGAGGSSASAKASATGGAATTTTTAPPTTPPANATVNSKAHSKVLALVVIPTACILLLLLLVVGAIINNAVRRHLIGCASRRIYRPGSGLGPGTAAELATLARSPAVGASSESLASEAAAAAAAASAPPKRNGASRSGASKPGQPPDPFMEQLSRKLESIKEES
ncbi:envelope glycoprotein I [Equid alphaherpesvirus 3]|uniref:Envelope glycoprotein I n=1 Tax=Equid alphaherpesvirus 3 TaxID=80341 RepID=A0A077B9U1_9ALPH|nr:envelope glycoprotein I [Equid alphaherpesvirus 3]AIL02991.1 envelope glycoprotein I [Equid alphaherpesvirus 3]